jgi:allophanate hydrolase
MTTSLADLLAAHRAGISPVDTMRAVYAAIRAWNDPALFITLRDEEDAVAAAAALDPADAARLPLFGVPFAVKDNIDVAGLPTTAGCPAFAYTPETSAFVVARLVAAGAIPIGKTNLDQFATGLVGVRSPYGVPRNARDPALIPGGSSSGSASAVAAGIVPFALGTDTAGSGRVPAALQGLVGLKPSLGMISTSGVVPACRTLDCVSIFARTAADAHAVLAVAAAYDAGDAYARRYPAAAAAAPTPLRIGVPSRATRRFLDAAAEPAFDATLADLVARGASIVELDFEPFFETAALLYEGPWVAERFAATKPLIERDPGALHPVTRTIIEGAHRFDAVSTFEAFYRLAALRRRIEPVWREIDVLAVPTIAAVYTVADIEADPVRLNSTLGLYTNFTNLLDLCAIALPGPGRSDGRPSGFTLIAPAGRDDFLAGLAMTLESAAPPPPAAIETLPIAVVGAHLSGLPLNGQLTALGATLVREARTSDRYRLYRLAGGPPLRPGLMRGAAGSGAAIALEIWALPVDRVGTFLAQIPAPLGLGTVELADGSSVKGFICEAAGLDDATDITGHGGWRAYLASL